MNTVQQLFDMACRHHQAGGFAQAEQLYRQILQVDPGHVDAWCFLGAACQSQGRLAEAETHFRRSVQIMPSHASGQGCLGVVQAQQGKLDEAIATFQEALRYDPNNSEILNNLGVAQARQGKLAESADSGRQAVRCRPDYPEGHYNLGLSLRSLSQFESAIFHFREAVRLRPDYAEAYTDLGNVFVEQGDLEQAMAQYRRALQARHDYAEAYCNMAVVMSKQGKTEEAIAHYQQAARVRPGDAATYNNLGKTLRLAGRLEQAIASFHQAVRCQPGDPETHFNLGFTLAEQGKSIEAATAYQEALRCKSDYAPAYLNLASLRKKEGNWNEAVTLLRLALRYKPDYAEAHNSLGNALIGLGRWDEAVACFHEALRFNPKYAEAHFNLGAAFIRQDKLEEAIRCCKEALRLQPNFEAAHSGFISCLDFAPNQDPDEVFEEHRRWGRDHAPKTPPAPHANTKSSERRLRIGYVSPDLRQHALARYLEPVLAHHDPSKVEVFCYAEVAFPDAATRRLQKMSHHWRWTCGQKDAELAKRIRDDQIDILVDLAGHTAGNRLAVFALKPAPVQATWLGYLNTTGLTAIDYRLTDNVLDPPGQPVRDTEELVRLPDGFCCFAPPVDSPPVAPLPALRRGQVTFGSLSNLVKINSSVIDLWSEVLKALPESRLLMFRHTLKGEVQDRIRGQFTQRGIGADRLDLRHGVSTPGYLGVYDQIDVSLDTFPCTGGVTTCESLWMGVPVLSLCGARPAARNSAAIMSRVGLADWAVPTPEQFVALAVRTASALDELAQLRIELRDRMTATLCDARRFTQELEDAYRTMWRTWCAKPG